MSRSFSLKPGVGVGVQKQELNSEPKQFTSVCSLLD